MAEVPFDLTPQDRDMLAQMVYGENVSDPSSWLMTGQSAVNRLRSGRKKEFGGTLPEVLKKGYYAVSKNSPTYQQAASGQFPDVGAKAKYGEIRKVIDMMLADQNFGKAQFYFKPEEEEKLRAKKSFNFKAVKPAGKVGQYNTYFY